MSRPLHRSILGLRTRPSSRTVIPRWSISRFNRQLTTTTTTTTTASFTGTTAQIQPTPPPQPPKPHVPKPRRVPPTAPTPSPDPPGALSDSVRQLLPVLRAQPSHYITIHIHGFPYLVTVGDQLRLPTRIPGLMPGDVLRLNRASVLGSRDYTLKGAPFVDETFFECRATVIGVEAEPMRVVVKKKQRCRRKTTVRNKMRFTVLRISELKIKSIEEIEVAGARTVGP